MQGPQYARITSAFLSAISLKREQGTVMGEPEVIMKTGTTAQVIDFTLLDQENIIISLD